MEDHENQEFNNWYKIQINEILNRNYQSSENWSKYKYDTETTKSSLVWLPKKLSHEVMVPIGPRALMRGKIVHTNEFLVNIGDNWFVKKTACQAQEICDRRLKFCEEMTSKLEKERNLIYEKQQLPYQNEAFGSEDRPEIIEEVTEDEYKAWKEEHEEKEKEYRKKLAELKNKEKKTVETEEDLWQRLDELELIEELEDEISKLNENDEGESDESEKSEEGSTEMLPRKHEAPQIKKNQTENKGSLLKTYEISKQVSFNDATEHCAEPLVLNFLHSSEENVRTKTNEILTPADIYGHYKENNRPKSILKKSKINLNQAQETSTVKELDELHNSQVDNEIASSNFEILDVRERNKNVNSNCEANKELPKKISKFKLSRMKK